MSHAPTSVMVCAENGVACIRIAGRANFHGSVDFKTLVQSLREQGYRRFVLDLTECQLMDSTFLGVLAGLGLKFSQEAADNQDHHATLELLNPSNRIADLLDNLGIIHLFKILNPENASLRDGRSVNFTAGEADRQDLSRTCLEAHKTLMDVNPANVSKFKDVTRFLEENLKKLEKTPHKEQGD